MYRDFGATFLKKICAGHTDEVTTSSDESKWSDDRRSGRVDSSRAVLMSATTSQKMDTEQIQLSK